MHVASLLEDEDAVSPVIGVILMVAITVILAAIIGTFALGFTEQTADDPPRTAFDLTFRNGSALDVTHRSGSEVDDGRLSVRVGDAVAYEGSGGTGDVLAPFDDPSYASDGWTDTVEPGDTISLYDDAASHVGETVRVVWTESEGGGQTATLDEREWP